MNVTGYNWLPFATFCGVSICQATLRRSSEHRHDRNSCVYRAAIQSTASNQKGRSSAGHQRDVPFRECTQHESAGAT